MIDRTSYKKINQNYDPSKVKEKDKLKDIPHDSLHCCAPAVVGYSFARRKWGRFISTKLSEITWRPQALDSLVLPNSKKSLIKSLVDVDRSEPNMLQDLVPGKGEGCLLLLYGPPGTGKTLTAEAIAEDVRRPLMVVSAGELGDSAWDIERNFVKILTTADLWNAIVLFDEADIFLETRSSHNHFHNSVVSTFLRLLEYHRQVIFLTTNRIRSLDSAVLSRISVVVEYPDLNRKARGQIWRSMLEKNKVEITEGESKSDDHNGRTISEHEIGRLAMAKLNGRYWDLTIILTE
jgi:SpoVK/Ycf46/Vps4 family AAA+-type ATPase